MSVQVIHLWPHERDVCCVGCGEDIVSEGHSVCVDDCGAPTQEDTGGCRECCKAFHDFHYGFAATMSGCPVDAVKGARS